MTRDTWTSTPGAADAHARHHSDFDPDQDRPSWADVPNPDPPLRRPLHPGWAAGITQLQQSGLDPREPF